MLSKIKLYQKVYKDATLFYFDSACKLNVGKVVIGNATNGFLVDSKSSFIPSSHYLHILDKTLSERVYYCPVIEAQAKHQKIGYFTINDQRAGVWGILPIQ